jgi:hypothetical protein
MAGFSVIPIEFLVRCVAAFFESTIELLSAFWEMLLIWCGFAFDGSPEGPKAKRTVIKSD